MRMRGWVLALALLLGGNAVAEEFAGRPALERLSGVWESPAPEPWYGGWGTRRFEFGNGRWSLVFIHALDPAMQRRTFQFRTQGPYSIGAPGSVPGSFAAVFGEEVKLVTLLTPDPAVAAAYRIGDCGLRLGEEVDISARGCGGWRPVAECGEDHDLLALRGREMFFGVRPRDNDMCTAARRPTALLPPVLRRD